MSSYSKKRDVCRRYGGVTPRTIERAVEAGRLPPPKFPFGNTTPLWDNDELDAHDRAAATAATFGRRPGARREPPVVRNQRKQQKSEAA